MTKCMCLVRCSSSRWVTAQAPKQQEALKLKMMRDLYGPGLPACRQIETQILSKCATCALPSDTCCLLLSLAAC